jgi:hypothetical protein
MVLKRKKSKDLFVKKYGSQVDNHDIEEVSIDINIEGSFKKAPI